MIIPPLLNNITPAIKHLRHQSTIPCPFHQQRDVLFRIRHYRFLVFVITQLDWVIQLFVSWISARRDCVVINLCFIVEKNGSLKLLTTNFFEILMVKPLLKMSIFILLLIVTQPPVRE